MNSAESRASLEGPLNTIRPWPIFGEEELAAVARVLRSGRVNYWTGGQGRGFEEAFSARVGRRHAVALANGSVALELALRALGVGPGDEVIVPSRTFVATASCVVLVGATPVFADIDADSQNLTVATLEQVRTARTRAIIPVHLAGWPCDMDAVCAWAAEHDMRVIEDCAQALGACYRGRPVGSFGDIGVFSFCQDKILTTGGEGGMLVTDDPDCWERAWSYKDHGKNPRTAVAPRTPGFRWVHDHFGSNLRMTEMQAAIGLAAMPKLDSWLRRRRENASILSESLADTGLLRVPQPAADLAHAYYKFYVFVRPERLAANWSRDRILQAMWDSGLPAGAGSCGEVYREKSFRDAGLGPHRPLPVARQLAETSLMLEVHPGIDPDAARFMGRVLREIALRATAD